MIGRLERHSEETANVADNLVVEELVRGDILHNSKRPIGSMSSNISDINI
jgi:hypothetical protein